MIALFIFCEAFLLHFVNVFHFLLPDFFQTNKDNH